MCGLLLLTFDLSQFSTSNISWCHNNFYYWLVLPYYRCVGWIKLYVPHDYYTLFPLLPVNDAHSLLSYCIIQCFTLYIVHVSMLYTFILRLAQTIFIYCIHVIAVTNVTTEYLFWHMFIEIFMYMPLVYCPLSPYYYNNTILCPYNAYRYIFNVSRYCTYMIIT